jgi:hypothetical protein
VHEEHGKDEHIADEEKPDNALEAYGATESLGLDSKT